MKPFDPSEITVPEVREIYDRNFISEDTIDSTCRAYEARIAELQASIDSWVGMYKIAEARGYETGVREALAIANAEDMRDEIDNGAAATGAASSTAKRITTLLPQPAPEPEARS